MKITVDTNILISGLFWEGNERKLIELAEEGEIELVLSEAIIEEFEEVLSRNEFKLKLNEIESNVGSVIDKILSIATITEPQEKINAVEDDKDDNIVLECALSGEVRYIVSGDRHLFELYEFRGIPILRARKMMEMINSNFR